MIVKSNTAIRAASVVPPALWFISLALPSVGWGKPPLGFGIQILFLGALGMIYGQFAWLANVFILPPIGLIFFDKPRYLGIFEGIIALSLLWLGWQAIHIKEITTSDGTFPMMTGPGYYIWLGAVIIQSLVLLADVFLCTLSPDSCPPSCQPDDSELV